MFGSLFPVDTYLFGNVIIGPHTNIIVKENRYLIDTLDNREFKKKFES